MYFISSPFVSNGITTPQKSEAGKLFRERRVAAARSLRATRAERYFFAALSTTPASGPCMSLYPNLFEVTSTEHQLLLTVSGDRALYAQLRTRRRQKEQKVIATLLNNVPGRIFQGQK
jgi:hypothetical protein